MSHDSLRDEGTHVYLEYGGREVGLILAEDEQGVLQYFPGFVDEMAPEQQTGPFSYDSRPKTVSQPVYFDTWDLGAGWEDAPAGSVTFGGYSYSQGIDASWGVPILSPERQSLVGISDEVTKYYRSPTFGYYALAGDNVYRWSGAGGEWVLAHEDEMPATDIIEFSNDAGTYLFLAFGVHSDVRFSMDGREFPAEVLGRRAQYFAVRGVTSTVPSLAGIKENGKVALAEDPTLDANWSNEDQIGLPSEIVTAVVVANNTFFIFKETGWYTFDGVNVGDQLPTYILRREGNGKGAYVHIDGMIYAPFANRLLAINPLDNSVQTVWEAAHREVNGSITALGGDLRHLYFALKNAVGDTYIMKGVPSTGVFDTWAYLGANDCAAIVSAEPGSLHSTNPAVLFGYGSSSAYFILPRDGYRPWDDENYRFSPHVPPTSAPVVASVTESIFESDVTSHPVDMPAAIEAGDLLLLLYTSDGNPTITEPAGWGTLYELGIGTAFTGVVFARAADGTEGGTTIDVATSAAETGAAQVYHITGWYGDIAGVVAGTAVSQSGVSPDAPAVVAVSAPNLLITAIHFSFTPTITAAPADYTNVLTTRGGSGTTQAVLGSARRALNGSGDDPGVWTLSATVGTVVNTIAVRPSELTLPALYGPWVDAGVLAYEKWLNVGRLNAESVTGGRTVQLDYSVDGSDAFTLLTPAVSPGATVERVDGVDFLRLRYAVRMTTGSNYDTPRVQAVVFDTTPNPPRHRAWPLVVRVEQRQAEPGGGDARPSAYRDIENFLFGAAGQRATFTDYWGATFVVKVLDVRGMGMRRKSGGEGRKAAAMDIQVLLAEISTNEVHGNAFVWGQSKWGAGDVWSDE